MRRYDSVRTRSGWRVGVNPDGSPLDGAVLDRVAMIHPSLAHGIDLRRSRVA